MRDPFLFAGKPAPTGGQQAGFTLVEMVITIVALAIALLGITAAISGGIGRSGDTLVETRAVALAQSYLDEIFGKRFDENSHPRGIPPCRTNCTDAVSLGLDAGETERYHFDDVDDYDGLEEGADTPDPLQDSEGQNRTGYANYRVEVSVRYLEPCTGEAEAFLGATPDVCAPDTAPEIEALEYAQQTGKLVTVKVIHETNSDGWDFSVYKANF
jgi:MSHA pilin protein MshD